jgi:hypothetical protein
VALDSDEEEIRPTPNSDSSGLEEEHAHEGQTPKTLQPQVGPQSGGKAKPRVPAKGGVIETLSRVPRDETIRIKGLIQERRHVTTLVDGGAIHNFIDATLVSRRGLQTEEFEGFTVAVADGYTVTCLDKVPDLEVKLGNYTMTDTFYVVELSETDAVLGVQWFYSLSEIGFNYQILTMSFKDTNGSKVVLRGMSTGAPRTVSTKRMERSFRHGDVVYAA